MTTRQLKNKLIRILSLPTSQIIVTVDSHGCYTVNLTGLQSFAPWFTDYIRSQTNTSSRIHTTQIILQPEEWEAILAGIEINDTPIGRTISIIEPVMPQNNPIIQEEDSIPQVRLTYNPPAWRNTPSGSFDRIMRNTQPFGDGVNTFSSFYDELGTDDSTPRRIGRPAVWGKCIKCSAKTKIVDLIPIRIDAYACSDCFVSHFTECERCKKYATTKDNVIATNGKSYCRDCIYVIGFICRKDGKAYANKKFVNTTQGFIYCFKCRDEFLAQCRNCNAYEDLTLFTICSVCDKTVCRNCLRDHERNCFFRELTEIKFIDGKKENSMLPFNRYVGVEIEAERGEIKGLLKDIGKDVGLTRDGSLEDRGVEVQTPPATFDALENMIKEATKVLKSHKYKGTVNCGLHLHFDARDIVNDHKKIIQVIKTFYAVEDIIYSMLPPSRWGTHYCQQLNKNYLYKNFKKQLKKNDTEKEIYKETNMRRIERRKNNKYDAVRYYGLNIHSIFFRKTIELRYHSGTIEDYKIINWINIASRIIDYAINRYNEKEIEAMFNLATGHDKFKAFYKLFQLPNALIDYMHCRLLKFNPNYRILFNKGKEARESERKDIKKKTKVLSKVINKLYPQAYKDVVKDFNNDLPSPRDLKRYVRERASDLARQELSKDYFNLPLDGGFIKDRELEDIRVFMEQGRQLSQGAEGSYDEAEM